MKDRSNTEQKHHDKIVQGIAKIRFPYPDKEHPNWKTYENHPERKMGVKHKDNVSYPDIVVLNTETDRIFMSGEIEPESSVTAQAAQQWGEYSILCDLYLYVPKGYGNEAKKLSKNPNIKGFREYEVNRNGELIVTNC